MNTLKVKSYEHSYDIYIEKKLRFKAGDQLNKEYSQIAIVTDEHVSQLYLEDVKQSIDQKCKSFIIPSGEQSKSLTKYEEIQKYLLNNNFDRHSAIIALGGGVVGDLAGFVAATYMRGIDFIQVPTTLLAHDSSVGGKVGINLLDTKNILGSFYPPQAVIYDTEMLQSLNEQELRSGFAEMVKHGFIFNVDLLNELKGINTIDPSHPLFDQWLIKSLSVKKHFVEQDEHEGNIRRFLNFGHTLGHAIESTKSHVTHGECVMYGMLFAIYLSDCINDKDEKLFNEELVNWVKNLGFPLNLINISDISTVSDKMLNDKKNSNQFINFVLLNDLGEPFVSPFSIEKIEEHLKAFLDLKALKGV
ncbi:3-dehydroquinate synthase [Filobacillus milosensis]|uniref:3-dehydroquinate synthase n=1 Tax=Filobacillus milosensis TaxID=94137 RepID=A0A4Y8IUV2_9BACI|nr:3-dehydroquinate synthase [Filobacillus milosensis]TFB23969.1 3-dehydroquinate synthase [Filobacillus milosensis]